VAYDDPTSFITYIFIFHEAFQIPGLAHHILCPNQLRDNDVIVNDVPFQYTPEHQRNAFTHSISTNDLTIPLTLQGIHSSFTVRIPTEHEIAHPHLYPQRHLTAEHIWDPHDITFDNNEYAIRHSLNLPRYLPSHSTREISEIGIHLSTISRSLEDYLFPQQLDRSILIPDLQISVVQYRRQGTPSAADLSKRWFIRLTSAQRTLDCTTQLGVRNFSASQGTRRLRTTTYQLMYKHLRSSVYTDTMFAKNHYKATNVHKYIQHGFNG
jgi:hypothetical protein